jgi:hypothetical protein
MSQGIKLRMIRQQAKAIYYNCQAAACFAYADADKISDDKCIDVIALRREAQAYETVAEWIKGLIDII